MILPNSNYRYLVKKIIEVRFLTKSVGINAEKKILDYSENISSDIIMIFRLPELKAADFRKIPWCKK